MYSLFGPLPEKYCNIFLVLSSFSLFVFVLFSILTLAFVINILLKKEPLKNNLLNLFLLTNSVIMSFVSYIIQRLLYNMCKNN